MAVLDIACLGPLAVTLDGCPVAVGGPKQRAVLALLALHAGDVVSVDQLTDVVWGATAPRNPRAVLQVYVTNLRRGLAVERPDVEARLTNVGGGYRLTLPPGAADWMRFDQLVRQAEERLRGTDLDAAADLLRAAVELWHGPAFPDLAAAEYPPPELGRLEERRLSAIEDLLELDLTLGRFAEVAARSGQLVTEHPFRERIRVARIVALYRCGRQGDALAACRATRRFLADELGAEPGPDFVTAEQAVLHQDPMFGRPPARAAHGADGDRVPAAASSLVGRAHELADLHKLLIDGHVRLVTLTGPGGTGKTRLAMAAATAVGSAFPDGVRWVSLETISGADRVPGTIAAALGLTPPPGGDLAVAIDDHLRARRLLLVLDNFEHVVGAWPVVAGILRAAPGVVVLVTSRRPLEISGEQRFEVPQLAAPPSEAPPDAVETFDAVRLFVARARLVDRRFTIDEGSAGWVAEVCRRLDGLPLAIELAAARVADEGSAGLLASLPVGLAVLVDGPRDAPDRQRTLRATIDWSYRRLAAPHRAVFDVLGVFAAAPEPAAVSAVVGAAFVGDAFVGKAADGVLPALDELVRQSLLLSDVTGSEPRFPMLQTVRAFARDQLAQHGRESVARQRHAEHYLSVAHRQVARLHGPGQMEAFGRLHRERPEFDAALDWAAGGDDGAVQLALRLVGSLWDYWQTSGDVTVLRQRAMDALARDSLRDPAVRAGAASGAGTLCWLGGDLAAATRYHSEALALYRAVDDRVGVAWSMMCLSVQQVHAGRLDEAETLVRESLTLASAAGAPLVISSSHTVLGVLAFYRGDRAGADTHQFRALAIAREVGDEQNAAQTLINLSDIAEEAGDWARARRYVTESLQISARLGDKVKALFAVEAMAELRLRLGAPKDAARLLAAARRHRAAMAHPLDAHEQAAFDDIVEQTRAATGAVAFAIACAEGRSLTFDEAVAAALT